MHVLVILPGKNLRIEEPTLLFFYRTLLLYTARNASNPIFIRAYALDTDTAFSRKGCRARFLVRSVNDLGRMNKLLYCLHTAQSGRSFSPNP